VDDNMGVCGILDTSVVGGTGSSAASPHHMFATLLLCLRKHQISPPKSNPSEENESKAWWKGQQTL
jgi:hypothetical protein